MVPTTRLSIMTPPGTQPAPRPPRSQRRPKTRTRRLAFEICEPRLPLAALTGLTPTVDTVAADDLPAVEAAAEVCETTLRIRACDVPAADDADLGGKEPSPEVSPVEIVADEGDSSEPPGWNTLDAGPDPVWFSATLDGSDTTSSEPSPPLRFAQDQPEDSTGQEPSDQREFGDFSPIAGPAAVPSKSETERREWTTASIVRYPLPDGSQPGRPGDTGFPTQSVTQSAGFLDVGRIVTPGTIRRSLDSAPLARVELAASDAPPSNFETDLASGLSTRPPGSQETPAAVSPIRPSLTGENRGQRMMLLSSTHSQPRKQTVAPPFPVPASKPEASQVQARDDAPSDRSGERSSESGEPGTRPASLGSLPWAPRSTGPLADGRVSRSTMEGIAAFVLLAAGWFGKAHRRPRTFPEDSLDPSQFDSQQAAARDEFFGQNAQ